MTDRLTSKGAVFILVLVAASTTLASGSRQWVSGSVRDVVLGSSVLQGRGSDVAPGVMAAALVGLASVVVAVTSNRALRIFAVWATLLAAVLGVALVVAVLADPDAALSTLATSGTGRIGARVSQGTAGAWAWAALCAMLVMGVAGVAGLVGGSRWSGLSSRYDAGEGSTQDLRSGPGARGTHNEWDQLSRGDDPTIGP